MFATASRSPLPGSGLREHASAPTTRAALWAARSPLGHCIENLTLTRLRRGMGLEPTKQVYAGDPPLEESLVPLFTYGRRVVSQISVTFPSDHLALKASRRAALTAPS